MSFPRSVLSAVKASGLGVWYARNYDDLLPKGYSRERFSRAALEARDLFHSMRKALPDLPASAFQPYWVESLARLAGVLDKPLPESFLSIPTIRQAMVRRGWTDYQRAELAYIRQDSEFYQAICETFLDSRIGSPHLECSELRCSSSALGYLYYLARLRHFRRSHGLFGFPDHVTELGGGFGGFCRAFQWAHKTSTYTIIDLPEFAIVQYLFLTLSLPDHEVHLVSSMDKPLPQRGIRLVPIQVALAHPEAFSTDLFTSHFALTEAGESVRDLVYRTQFFSANEVYYIGQQAKRWAVNVDSEVIAALPTDAGWRRTVEPFHMIDCVEVYATRRPQATDSSNA